MQKRLLHLIKEITSLQNLFLLGTLLLLMFFVILPEAKDGIRQWSGGLEMLNKDWFFTPNEMYLRMESYGVELNNFKSKVI